MSVAAIRPWIAATAAALVFAACTGDDDAGPDSPTTSPTLPTSVPIDPSTSADRGELSEAEFELWLRRKLSLPALPSFAVPLEGFADARDVDLADRLDVSPGLYEGIAVVDLRCDAEGDEAAVDASGIVREADGSGTFREGDVEIVVQSDGSGRYTNASTAVVIQSDGSGSYESGTVQLEIQGDGSGSYRDGSREIEVDGDRSGSYTDGEVQVEVTANGSSTYRDGDRTIEVARGGEVRVGADDPYADAVARVLADGLPLFPPVPKIGAVPEPAAGTSCGSVIRLDANVLFDFNADTIRPDAAALLDRVAALLVALSSPPLRVDGHTDSVGTDEYNVDLSARRAESVRVALVERGVAGESVETRGWGESRPLAPNETADGADDPAGRQLNRRVELILLDAG